jgi:two-component system chemotaxis sensor kinase CheA
MGLDQSVAANPLNALASDPELLGDFVLEAREHLASIEAQLLILEQDPANAEAIHAIFRSFHTIKGLAGFLELAAIQEVSHEVETVLDMARNGQLAITPAVIDRILESKDYLSRWMAQLDAVLAGGPLVEVDRDADLLASIRALANAQPASEVPLPQVPDKRPEQVVELVELARAVMEAPESAEPAEEPCAGEERSVIPQAPVDPTHDVSERASAARSDTRQAESRLIKVDTTKLDFLVDMVGEMVIAQSLVQHDPDLALESRPRLVRNLSQLARITEEVQKTAMSMRMVPVGQLFRKMSRLVRDLSKKAGKQVELELVGEDTQLDRNIVEELADPIMHMVRNAIDHGVERPADRQKAGKSPVAQVSLKAAHQSGNILIEVSDDGRGLDRERILNKARKNGLIDPAAQPSDSEVFGLIFQPGFSTTEQVTDVSGRGVGMDVVRKHIQKLRGRVDIESTPGRGTRFLLKLPLTLAIIDGLVVGVGSQRYIVPIYAVREMLRPTEDMVSTVQDRSEMALVRGNLLPIVRLHQRFGVTPRARNPWEALLIVSESGGKRFCLMVDDLLGKQEVVIKSLGHALQGIHGVAGGAILGDGRVGLILDLEGLFGVPASE